MRATEELAAPAARCARLVRIYPSATGETHALRGVDATFPRSTVTAVTGPSGSGKSSLLSVLALRERQSGGELEIDGRDVASLGAKELRLLRRRGVAWVDQRPTRSLFPHLAAVEQVEQAARLRGADLDDCDALLDRLGLSSRRGARVGRLSGGEQQRVAVAVAVVGTPSLVVADEPTAELDDESSGLVLAELRRCAATGAGVVFASHDRRAVDVAARVLHLRHGVLSTESRGTGPATATIDSTGRLQLPPEALVLFPQGRAQVLVDGAGVRLLPPEDGAGSHGAG